MIKTRLMDCLGKNKQTIQKLVRLSTGNKAQKMFFIKLLSYCIVIYTMVIKR